MPRVQRHSCSAVVTDMAVVLPHVCVHRWRGRQHRNCLCLLISHTLSLLTYCVLRSYGVINVATGVPDKIQLPWVRFYFFSRNYESVRGYSCSVGGREITI